MRTCCQCGASFAPTGKGYRCPPCRKAYDQVWRAQRKAEGKSVSGTKMPREYHRAYEANYFQSQENRVRRNENMRVYRNSEATREHHKARSLVRRAVEAGRLIRKPCEVCGSSPADAHHDDYSKPLNVRWLCRPHHAEHHAKAEGRS